MAQKSIRSTTKSRSHGALRKMLGSSKKKTVHSKKRNTPEAKARANYIIGVEAAMASRVPSDQRSKLLIVKPGSGPVEKPKNKRKPLTRGRTRKSERKEK